MAIHRQGVAVNRHSPTILTGRAAPAGIPT